MDLIDVIVVPENIIDPPLLLKSQDPPGLTKFVIVEARINSEKKGKLYKSAPNQTCELFE